MSAMLRPSDLAAQWQCSAGHVRKLCRTGQLRAMRLGSDWRISPEAAAAYEAANTNERRAMPCGSVTAISSRRTAGAALPDGDYVPVFGGAVSWRSTQIQAASPSAARERVTHTKRKGPSEPLTQPGQETRC